MSIRTISGLFDDLARSRGGGGGAGAGTHGGGRGGSGETGTGIGGGGGGGGCSSGDDGGVVTWLSVTIAAFSLCLLLLLSVGEVIFASIAMEVHSAFSSANVCLLFSEV